jgi:hypothetical protein
LLERLVAGDSIRKAAETVGINHTTASRLNARFNEVFERMAADMDRDGEPQRFVLSNGRRVPACGCGKPAGHQEWCSYRFARSESRQAFMKRWHAYDKP